MRTSVATATPTTRTNFPLPIPLSGSRFFLSDRFNSFPSFELPATAIASFTASRAAAQVAKCTRNSNPGSGNGGSLKDLLSGMVDERIEQLLEKEDNRALLDGLEQASRRVEIAKRELAEIEKQEIEAKIMREYVNQLESRASEIAECQREISEAKGMLEQAEQSLTERGRDSPTGVGTQMVNKDAERLESVKAASVSAVVGTLADLPFSLARLSSPSQLILPLAITFVSCALFGGTFRYAVRRDLDNFHLKSGASAAFGVVKGLGMVGGLVPIELESGSIISQAFEGAGYVSESVMVFLFAGVAVDFCMKLGIISPFPSDQSVPRA